MTYFGIEDFKDCAHEGEYIAPDGDDCVLFRNGREVARQRSWELPVCILFVVNGHREPIPVSLAEALGVDNADPWPALQRMHSDGLRFTQLDGKRLKLPCGKIIDCHDYAQFLRRYDNLDRLCTTRKAIAYFAVMLLGPGNVFHPDDPWPDLMAERKKRGKLCVDMHGDVRSARNGDYLCCWWPFLDRDLLQYYNDGTVPSGYNTHYDPYYTFDEIAPRLLKYYGTDLLAIWFKNFVNNRLPRVVCL